MLGGEDRLGNEKYETIAYLLVKSSERVKRRVEASPHNAAHSMFSTPFSPDRIFSFARRIEQHPSPRSPSLTLSHQRIKQLQRGIVKTLPAAPFLSAPRSSPPHYNSLVISPYPLSALELSTRFLFSESDFYGKCKGRQNSH